MILEKVKGKVKQISNKMNIDVQTSWDMFFFENFLLRLSNSNYSKQFIFKGGFLLQNIIGVSQRTTMDLDFKMIGRNLEDNEIYEIFNSMCIERDNLKYKIIEINDIKAETKYGGKTVKIEGTFYNIKKTFGIDLGVGDVVTPYPKLYSYKNLIIDEPFEILAYPIETIIAEKFETLISKGTNNSRSKDLYDLYILNKHGYDSELLNAALVNTFISRGTTFNKQYVEEEMNQILCFNWIKDLYNNYSNKHKFASEVTFDDCVSAIRNIFKDIEFIEPIKLSDYKIELDVIRHGEDESGYTGGWSNLALTEKGKLDVLNLSKTLDKDYDLFISSDLLRAKQTAEIINNELQMNIIYSQDFRETNNGDFANMSIEEFRKNHLDMVWAKLDMDECYPNGDSPNSFFERIKNSLIKLLKQNDGKKILLVTHGGVVAVLRCLLEGYAYSNKIQKTIDTASVIKFK